jgi:aldehyde dehydrogenase (NAD+)
MWVDGAWVEASSGATFAVPNPATEETVGVAPDASVADVERAIAAARRAFDEGPWARSTPRERARALARIADGVERRKEALRALLVAEAGAAYLTHEVQLEAPIQFLRNYAALAESYAFDTTLPPRDAGPMLGGGVVSGVAYRQPVGVCALMPTWNFPLFLAAQKIGPALATGCTMVVKPSPYGPLVNLLLAEIVAEADLPPGVVNVVTTQAVDAAAALVTDPRIDKVSFTGSSATGKRIMELAAPTLKRVHLELGGKSVAMVLDADDLDALAPQVAAPAYFHAGQGCALATRVLVPRPAHDALVQKMVDFVSIVSVGDPADPSTMLGPVIRPERRTAIEAYIESGKREGAVLARGGGRPAHLARGWFVEPTIFCDVPNDLRIAREEIFGPVVAVIPVRDDDEAVRVANDSPYGLGGAIYARDTARAVALARRLRTGAVWINNGFNLLDAPFGGFKESGIGREGGRWGLEEYTEIQHIGWRG